MGAFTEILDVKKTVNQLLSKSAAFYYNSCTDFSKSLPLTYAGSIQ